MKEITDLLENNRRWSESIKARDPEFFQRLAQQQSPHYLWIGCSDSRVPATQLTGMGAGDLFVHRNVANVVVHTDFNFLSVLQYAVEVLKVSQIIVCGHYGCGGVKAAIQNQHLGLIDNWLRHVQDVMHKHSTVLSRIDDETKRVDKLTELHVIEQVLNVGQTTIVQNAWARGQELAVHGWIYGLEDGLVRDLNICVTNENELTSRYEVAIRTSA